jgi:two-component system, OmpR family, phosphate regulon response regulator PhoB
MTKRAHILVVDDDVPLQKMISFLLNRMGLDVQIADTGNAGLRALESKLPDVILLDMLLPDMNGIDFLKIVRADQRYQQLPIVVLSAIADIGNIRDGLAAGADRYLTKPYIASTLLDTISDAVRNGRRLS